MIASLFSICISCFNAGINVATRAVLIVLSASIYQGFVIVECFLYSYKQVYPPYFEARVANLQRHVSIIVSYVVKIVAKVIFIKFI